MAEATHATGTHASTAPAAEHGGAFPPFETGSFASQLIWLAISFGILFYVMSKYALPRVEQVLGRRAERIGGDLRQAETMRAEAQAAGSAYESAMAEARGRAKTIAQETRDALGGEADIRRKALEADLAARMDAAEATIRTRTAEAMSNVRGIASDTAAAIVERLTGRPPEPAALSAAAERSA